MLGWITSYRQVQVVSSIVSTYMPDIWKLNVNKSTQTHFPAQAVTNLPDGPSAPAVATAHCRGGGNTWKVEVKMTQII